MEYKLENKGVNEKFYVETNCYRMNMGLRELYEDVKVMLDRGVKVRNIKVRWGSWESWEKISWSWLKKKFEN